MDVFSDLYKNRKLIFSLSGSDFKKRFVGSYFGVLWMFVQPISTILIYFCVFQLGFRSTPPVDAPYILWLIPGIIPWFFISEGISNGTNCLSEYSFLVKKLVFKVELLPIIKLLSCLFVHAIFLLIMITVFIIYGRFPLITWFQAVYYSIAAYIFSLAITYFTSGIYIFFKDISQIVNICLQFGMWMTPIMWTPEIFPGHPEWLEDVLKINPVYYIVTGYRDSFLNGNCFWERPINTIYFWGATLVLLIFGLRIFKKLRPHFSDVL